MSRIRLSLDFETFSTVPISYGTDRYMTGAEVLLAAYQLVTDDLAHPIYSWDATVSPAPPVMLVHLLQDPEVLITAYNAPFERAVIRELLGIDLPPERFRCTMVRAYGLGFKGKMFEVGTQMEIDPELIKYHAEGQKLINRFCKPAPKGHKADRYTADTHPDEWKRFVAYNIQDVVAEAAIDTKCDAYIQTPEWNQQLWYLDQRINQRGVPIDLEAIHGAQKIREAAKLQIKQELRELTELDNPGSGPQLIFWLQQRGVKIPEAWSTPKKTMVPSLAAEPMEKMLSRDLSPDIREVLLLKQQLSKTSGAKFDSFDNAQVNGRVRGMFQFGGATRTARWAGRVVQLQNLPRPDLLDPEVAIEYIKTGNIKLLEACYG